MIVSEEILNKAKNLAQDNYETWGQYIVECYTDEELTENLSDFDTIEEWVDIRKSVANVIEERWDSGWDRQSSIWGRE